MTPRTRHVAARAALVAAAAAALGASEPSPSDAVLLRAMQSEIARATSSLRLKDAPPPYFVGYWVVDETSRSVTATLGAVVSDASARERFVKVEVRVGSPAFDNSGFTGSGVSDGGYLQAMELLSPRVAPVDDDVTALRRELWLATDGAYKNAVETLEQKRAARQTEIASRPEVPSFATTVSASVVLPDPPPFDFDPREVSLRASAVFRAFPEVQRSQVQVLSATTRRRFAASDGGASVEPMRFGAAEVTASAQADDGMTLDRSVLIPTEGNTLAVARVEAEARRLATELTALRQAKVAEDYSGPVLFEGKAAAQLLFELLGEPLSGTPPPDDNEELDGPLSRKLGKRILPLGVTIVDDPTLAEAFGTTLLGHYAVDDEGVRAERTVLVEDGHLRRFLMSRTPREGVLESNGHGRSGLGGWARGRPGNLLVTSSRGLSARELRGRLVAAAKAEGLPYGMVVTELTARTASTGGAAMPAPELAYRVNAKGEETLVRGATLSTMSVKELRSVVALGRDATVYGFVEENGNGLATGTSIASPSLLMPDVELRAPTTPNKRPPVVPRPPAATGAPAAGASGAAPVPTGVRSIRARAR